MDWPNTDLKTLGELTDRRQFNPHCYKWCVYLDSDSMGYLRRVCIGVMDPEGRREFHAFVCDDLPPDDEGMERAADRVRLTLGVDEVTLEF